MSFDISHRGFKHYDPVPTDYGHEVRVYESSAAMSPHIWLAIELKEAVGGIDPVVAHAHCSIEQAEKIRDNLSAAIANHYQLES